VSKMLDQNITAFGLVCVLRVNGLAYFDGAMLTEGNKVKSFASHPEDVPSS